ncbi:hemolysin III family protein [Octadecabacter sp.]|nr:hemolysin III family protein [Octadecabacter sp.]
MSIVDPYPHYTRAERIADAVVQGTGLAFAAVGAALLIRWAIGQDDAGLFVGVFIYCVAMVGSFLASMCYHFTPWERTRHLLQRIDHAAIYLKIAGTYTPLVVLIGSAFSYSVLAFIWVLAAVGAIAKLFFWGRQGRWGTVLYLGLGWVGIALFSSLLPLIPITAIIFIVAGGLIYSAGAVIFSLEDLRFQNAIWHGFVFVASACLFIAIALGTIG